MIEHAYLLASSLHGMGHARHVSSGIERQFVVGVKRGRRTYRVNGSDQLAPGRVPACKYHGHAIAVQRCAICYDACM